MFGSLLMMVLTAPGAQLDYAAAPELQGCPDEAWIRAAVSARLGRDPFTPDGGIRVQVRIAHDTAPAVSGALSVTREDGRVGRRRVDSPSGDCMEVASALELAISLALDPLVPKESPTLLLPDEAPPPAPQTPEPTDEPEAPPRWFLGGGVLLTAGAVPSVTGGMLVRAGVQLPYVRVALEARAHAPASVTIGDVRVSEFLAFGSAVPCFELGRFALCGVLSLGVMRFQLDATVQTSFAAQTGARVEVRFEPLPRFFLTPFLEATGVLTRPSVFFNGARVWDALPVSGTLGVLVELQLSS